MALPIRPQRQPHTQPPMLDPKAMAYLEALFSPAGQQVMAQDRAAGQQLMQLAGMDMPRVRPDLDPVWSGGPGVPQAPGMPPFNVGGAQPAPPPGTNANAIFPGMAPTVPAPPPIAPTMPQPAGAFAPQPGAAPSPASAGSPAPLLVGGPQPPAATPVTPPSRAIEVPIRAQTERAPGAPPPRVSTAQPEIAPPVPPLPAGSYPQFADAPPASPEVVNPLDGYIVPPSGPTYGPHQQTPGSPVREMAEADVPPPKPRPPVNPALASFDALVLAEMANGMRPMPAGVSRADIVAALRRAPNVTQGPDVEAWLANLFQDRFSDKRPPPGPRIQVAAAAGDAASSVLSALGFDDRPVIGGPGDAPPGGTVAPGAAPAVPGAAPGAAATAAAPAADPSLGTPVPIGSAAPQGRGASPAGAQPARTTPPGQRLSVGGGGQQDAGAAMLGELGVTGPAIRPDDFLMRFDPSIPPASQTSVAAEFEKRGMMGLTEDQARNLLAFGLATMSAGAQPGANVLGAVGQGGIAALQSAESTRTKNLKAQQTARENQREDRKLALDERKVATDAALTASRYEQMAQDKALDREQRAEAAAMAAETRRLIAASNAGNTAALTDLRRMEADRRNEEAATDILEGADKAAERMIASDLTAQTDPARAQQIRDEAQRRALDRVAQAHPDTRTGRAARADLVAMLQQKMEDTIAKIRNDTEATPEQKAKDETNVREKFAAGLKQYGYTMAKDGQE